MIIVAVVLSTLAAPDSHSQQDHIETKPPAFAPPQPFARTEALRYDFRGASPLTEQSLIVQPGAPLPLPWRRSSGAVIFQYRYDVLDADATRALSIDQHLHRFELGLPMVFGWSDDGSIDVDVRVIYAGPVDEHLSSGWIPSVRVGPTFRLSEDLSLGAGIFWSRGALGFIPVPVGTLYWRPTHGRFRVDALVPRYLEAAFRVADGIEAFGMFHFENHVWAVPREDNESTFLLRQEVRLQAGFRFDFLGPLAVELSTQWVPVQSADTEDAPAQTFVRGSDFSATVSIVLSRI